MDIYTEDFFSAVKDIIKFSSVKRSKENVAFSLTLNKDESTTDLSVLVKKEEELSRLISIRIDTSFSDEDTSCSFFMTLEQLKELRAEPYINKTISMSVEGDSLRIFGKTFGRKTESQSFHELCSNDKPVHVDSKKARCLLSKLLSFVAMSQKKSKLDKNSIVLMESSGNSIMIKSFSDCRFSSSVIENCTDGSVPFFAYIDANELSKTLLPIANNIADKDIPLTIHANDNYVSVSIGGFRFVTRNMVQDFFPDISDISSCFYNEKAFEGNSCIVSNDDFKLNIKRVLRRSEKKTGVKPENIVVKVEKERHAIHVSNEGIQCGLKTRNPGIELSACVGAEELINSIVNTDKNASFLSLSSDGLFLFLTSTTSPWTRTAIALQDNGNTSQTRGS